VERTRFPASITFATLGVATRTVKPGILLSCIFYFAAGALFAGDEPKHNAIPRVAGVVRDEATAIKIAVAVWEPIYGAEKIAAEKPFRATLANGVWTVQGSLPKGWKGGVALAEISKADGRIIRISHGK
jgi:hypothetical protein